MRRGALVLAALVSALLTVCVASAAPAGLLPGPSLLAPGTAGAGSLFQAGFDPADWSGGLSRFDVSVDADGHAHTGMRLWQAGDILSGAASGNAPLSPSPAPAMRRIYTSAGPFGAVPLLPFEWSRLPGAQRALLDVAPDSGLADGLGPQRLAYLRGERSLEAGRPGGMFRPRGSVLGDIVHATPLYLGAPAALPPGAGHDAFYLANRARRSVVYVGANDGMLHAFDADGGNELFAYVPQALIGALNALSGTHYAHRPYVDGAAGAGDAPLRNGWASVLVVGMGGGAAGVFALDVTDPDHFDAGAGALWEFTDHDDVTIGNVTAAPAIARFKVDDSGGVPVYRYFAVVAGGPQRGTGALFLLALDKRPGQAWRRGVNYYKLSTPVAAPGDVNALAPPVLVPGSDGAVRYAYAGDLQGNLWRLDFSGRAPWSGGVGGGASGQPLFVARDGAGARQPITEQAQVVFAPGGGYLVLFGTGDVVEPSATSPSAYQPQSFYAIRDALDDTAVTGRAALAARTLSGPADGAAGFVVAGPEYAGQAAVRGWYLDFPLAGATGERSVSAAVLAAGKVFFNTVVPGSEPGALAAARSYAFDSLSGYALGGDGVGRDGAISGQAMPADMRGAPVVLRTSAPDAAPAGARQAAYVVLAVGQTGAQTVAGGRLALSVPAGRLSWREVANWRELHEAAP